MGYKCGTCHVEKPRGDVNKAPALHDSGLSRTKWICDDCIKQFLRKGCFPSGPNFDLLTVEYQNSAPFTSLQKKAQNQLPHAGTNADGVITQSEK